MPKVDRGGRWHATIPRKGNRWIDMPDRALDKLADLLEFEKIPRDVATAVRHEIGKGRITEAQDHVQKFMDEFPFDEIVAQEQDRLWTDGNGEETTGPVEQIQEALQAFVDASPDNFESADKEEADPEDPSESIEEKSGDKPDEAPAAEAPVADPVAGFSKKVDAARAAIEELKNSGLTPEQVKAVDRALSEINDLVAQVSKSKDTGIAEPYDSSDEIREKSDEEPVAQVEPEGEDQEAEPEAEAEPAAGPRHRAEDDPAEESHEAPEETPDEPAESDPADADAQSEIAAVAKLKKAFEDGYKPADEHIWQGKRGSVEIGNLADGTKVVRKVAPNEEEADKEHLIGLVANVLGVDVFTAKVSETELVTNHIQGGTGNEWLRQQYNDADTSGGKNEKIRPWRQAGQFEKKALEMKNAKEMGLLDWLVQNPDRHAGNWMVREGDEIVPIDHGNSKFESTKFMRGDQEMEWFNGSPFMKHWLGIEVGQYKTIKSINPGKHWDKAELQQYRSKLAGLKDEFASRPEWHDAIMVNIDRVLENMK